VGAKMGMMSGPNKDIVLYLDYNNIEKESINQVAYLIDVERKGLSFALAEGIIDSGLLDRGINHIRENLHTERIRSSQNALKKLSAKGINMENLSYLNSPTRVVKSSVVDNPKTQSVVAEEKKKIAFLIAERMAEFEKFNKDFPTIMISVGNDKFGRCRCKHICHKLRPHPGIVFLGCCDDFRGLDQITYAKTYKKFVSRSGKRLVLVTQDTQTVDFSKANDFKLGELVTSWCHKIETSSSFVPDSMWDKFRWLRVMQYEFKEELPYRHSVSPIGSIDHRMTRLVSQIGVSSRGNSLTNRLSKALAKLRRDPYFPQDITPETIISLLKNPSIGSNLDTIYQTLIAIGASPDDASEITSISSSLVEDFLLVESTSGYSVTDSAFSALNLGLERVTSMVEVGEVGGTLSATFRNIGVALILGRPYHEKRRKVRILLDTHLLMTVEDELRTGMADSLLSYIGRTSDTFL
jgi:hypothetical protein